MAPFPILQLEEIAQFSKQQDVRKNYFHVFGIFLQEEANQNSHYWILSDNTCLRGLKIKLIGPIDDYPRPKPGDIVRIHRLSFDQLFHVPNIGHPRNVVYWSAFQYQPNPISKARSPTITPEDDQKRRVLETLYCSMITLIREIKPNQNSNHKFYTVAGRVEEKSVDQYYNSLLTFSDGTGQFVVRVFQKKVDFEIDYHNQVVNDLKVGDYFVLSGGKLDSRGQKLDLSANLNYGRSIRFVHQSSLLGVVLKERLSTPSPERQQQVQQEQQQLQQQEQRTQQQEQQPQQQEQQTQQQEQQPQQQQQQQQPNYTRLADIKKEERGFYHFCDLAGQVRGKPNETRAYKNWVFQLNDGSKPDYRSFSIDEVKEPARDCVTILVYSKQKESDTDQHIETVKRLKEGDLVFVKNCKVSWKQGSLKLEINANLAHGKSITLIDRESPFGLILRDIVENPLVEELFQTGPADSDDSP